MTNIDFGLFATLLCSRARKSWGLSRGHEDKADSMPYSSLCPPANSRSTR
jgi:hypothetical protein